MTLCHSSLGEQSSFTNDLNNLDIMDDSEPAAETLNSFADDGQMLNAWDTEGKKTIGG